MTQTAKQMCMRFGMSEKLGPRVLGHSQGAPFLGRDLHSEPDYSDETAREIDAEIRRIIDGAHQEATRILNEHRSDLESLSKVLLRRETIDREEFIALLAGAAEEDVFRAKDEEARRRLQDETDSGKGDSRRLTIPPPPPQGKPVTEA